MAVAADWNEMRAPSGLERSEEEEPEEDEDLIPNEVVELEKEALDAALNEPCKKAGYLMKRGGSWKSWNARWFMLTDRWLLYKSDKGKKDIKGCILAGDVTHVRETESIKGGEVCIEIGTPERIYYLFSPAEHAQWMQALQGFCLVPEFPEEPLECYKIWRTAFEADDRATFVRFKEGSQNSRFHFATLRNVGMPCLSEMALDPPADIAFGDSNGKKTCVISTVESRFGITGRILLVENTDDRGWLVKKEDWKAVINKVRAEQAAAAGKDAPPQDSRPSCSGVLTVTVIEGVDLIAQDKNELSDPYILITGGEGKKVTPAECKTKVVSKSLNPQWNEVFHVSFTGLKSINLSVFDHDVAAKDDPMGAVEFDIGELLDHRPHDLWLTLKPNGELLPAELGRIHVVLLFKDEISRHVSDKRGSIDHGAPVGADVKKFTGSLTATVMEGENLIAQDMNGFSDPYVEVSTMVDSKKGPKPLVLGKTTVQKKTLNPTWNEVVQMRVDVAASAITIKCKDWDRMRSGDPMGSYTIPLGSIADGEPHDLWLNLVPGDETVPFELGRIHVLLLFKPDGAEDAPATATPAADPPTSAAADPPAAAATPATPAQ